MFRSIYKKLKLLSLIVCQRLRANYYGIFYNIGRNCRFEKITFTHSTEGFATRDSIKIGNRVTIFRNTEICSFSKFPVSIGDDVFINQGCIINPNVTIGNKVSIGHRVVIIPSTHKIGTKDKRAGELIFPPIAIEDGCWIGANSTILGVVTIGRGTVIAAGSVVTKDCEPNCIYGGVPARLIKRLTV